MVNTCCLFIYLSRVQMHLRVNLKVSKVSKVQSGSTSGLYKNVAALHSIFNLLPGFMPMQPTGSLHTAFLTYSQASCRCQPTRSLHSLFNLLPGFMPMQPNGSLYTAFLTYSQASCRCQPTRLLHSIFNLLPGFMPTQHVNAHVYMYLPTLCSYAPLIFFTAFLASPQASLPGNIII
ncbi:hypothetical protein HDV64DRAFT_189363 [Trichoderma sp. TUCIM 5745]